ncbi:MAG: 5-(carboxyamino)imidazole ribonucleotide synthase [Bacteroidota bacterium]
MIQPILPPATIGIIGGGQLGMMIAREAQRMGYRTVVWDPEAGCPASRLADETITAPFSDREAAERLANRADVVTYEFENVDPEIVAWIEGAKPVFPGSGILRVAQHRREEKEELKRLGFPTVAYLVVTGATQVREAIGTLGLPVVIKTATSGYDGKGQTVIHTAEDLDQWGREDASSGEFVVEQFIDLSCELSVVAARTRDGLIVTFPVGENVHRENILHRTIVPPSVSHEIQAEALRIARAVMDTFNVVGVLCTEMFVTRHGEVLVNELAPRPHNSGHYTLDACDVSQFEVVVRTVCGLPVKQPRLLTPCAMINLLGKHLERLNWKQAMNLPGVKVHLYGKKESRPKRKMGHVTVLNYSWDEVWSSVMVLEEMIGEGESVAASSRIQPSGIHDR